MDDAPKLTFEVSPPTPTQLAEIAAAGSDLSKALPLYVRYVLVPENLTRAAYTVLRDIFLDAADEWAVVLREIGKPDPQAWLTRFNEGKRKLDDIDVWLKPPTPPFSLENAAQVLKIVGDSQSVKDMLMKQIGKRPRRGQPASKRYLALIALDIKCAYSILSLRDVTDLVCPCGKPTHSSQCREQMRQQVNRLVRFLKPYGHDFTWERVGK
jgi:hypothetical protein